MSTKKEAVAVVASMRLVMEVDDPNRTSPTMVADDTCKLSNCIATEDDATIIANLQMVHRARTAGDVEARDDENEGANGDGDVESVDTMDLTETGTFIECSFQDLDRFGPERRMIFNTESLGIKLQRSPTEGIVHILRVTPFKPFAFGGSNRDYKPSREGPDEGHLELGDTILEVGGVDLREKSIGIAEWADMLHFIKHVGRPLGMVVSKDKYFMCPQMQLSNIHVNNSSMERDNISDGPHENVSSNAEERSSLRQLIRQLSFMNKNENVGRSPPPISYGKNASESKSVEVLHHPEETNETLSKDKPPKAQLQSAEISKVGETNKVSKGDAAKYSPSKADAVKTKSNLGWRAAKDPNSGLIYYYHAETRETTWKKPPGFVPTQAPAKGTTRSARRPATKNQDKPKVVDARGFMGFLSKMKTKPEAETNVRAQKSPTKLPTESPNNESIEIPNNSSMERDDENNDSEKMNSIIQDIIEDFTPKGDQKILRAIGRTATVNAAILITAATGGAAGAIGYVTGGAITAKRLSDGIIQKDEKEVTKSLAVYGCATGASIAGQAITGAVMIGIVGASLPLAGVVAFGVGCCSGVTAGALSEWTVDSVMDRVKGRRKGNDTLERCESDGALLNRCNESSQEADELARSQSCRF